MGCLEAIIELYFRLDHFIVLKWNSSIHDKRKPGRMIWTKIIVFQRAGQGTQKVMPVPKG